ncbi:histidinol-phosphate transaminase [Halalkaliarchaeum sp. AArc-GB]|uniref:histidinol-phosphate transaminase n=1 Tax=Halalkaliarchaeum sp. AArc-GB TaxID=3074078 RepID=UPI00285BBE63|nr:histidinol-phosphate transaminase [Halalkaliarchaeum sp. AArc-GB]MDR5672105.1 histidinol-phosphate transaminase [Halalkaliarchaeum sp. AArc-GB]
MQPRDLSSHSPYVPGSGIEEVARELGVDPDELVALSSNENPHGPSPAAVEAIRENADRIHQYPKAAHADLTDRIAAEWGVDSRQVWLSPGADGALDYLARAMLSAGDRVLVPDPGFAYYPMSARYHHGTVATYDLSSGNDFAGTADAVLSAYDGERIVYVTTPHNPAGSEFPRHELLELLSSVEDRTLVIVDEAYGEYSESPSSIELLDSHRNLAVTRTFSKAYGLAGLRVGYAVVPGEWGDAYARVNTPFAVNELACRAAMAALGDDDHLRTSVETARWSREYLRSELDARTVESAANFVLVHVGDAKTVAERSKRAGVVIRDCTSFGLPEYVRISCGTREETTLAVETLNEVLTDADVAGVRTRD